VSVAGESVACGLHHAVEVGESLGKTLGDVLGCVVGVWVMVVAAGHDDVGTVIADEISSKVINSIAVPDVINLLNDVSNGKVRVWVSRVVDGHGCHEPTCFPFGKGDSSSVRSY